jgi:hypothetical protein
MPVRGSGALPGSTTARSLSGPELSTLEKELAWLDMTDGVAEGLARKRAADRRKQEDRAANEQFRTEVAQRRRNQELAEQRRLQLRAEFLDSGPRSDGTAAELERAREDAQRKQHVQMRQWEDHEYRARRKQQELAYRRRLAFQQVTVNEEELAAMAARKREELARVNADVKAKVKRRCETEEERARRQRRANRIQWLEMREEDLARARRREEQLESAGKNRELMDARERRREEVLLRKSEFVEEEAQVRDAACSKE